MQPRHPLRHATADSIDQLIIICESIVVVIDVRCRFGISSLPQSPNTKVLLYREGVKQSASDAFVIYGTNRGLPPPLRQTHPTTRQLRLVHSSRRHQQHRNRLSASIRPMKERSEATGKGIRRERGKEGEGMDWTGGGGHYLTGAAREARG